jgi:3-hydroxybutyryl-CoA dehydratase
MAELIPERSRAGLTCVCKVGRQVMLDGEALVRMPREEKGKRPLMRL